MILSDLLKEIYKKPLPEASGNLSIETISCDSRQKQVQGFFVALSGYKVNGEDFIKDAIHQGAVVIAKKGANRRISKPMSFPNASVGNLEVANPGPPIETFGGDSLEYIIPDSVVVLDVEDPKSFLREITLRFYDHPSRKVRVVGVTGTNGKTTITYLLENIFKVNDQDSAVIGTINYRVAGRVVPSKNTTPGFLENQSLLNDLALAKIPYCTMEVSSHALDQGRVDGIDFVSAIFTNLTQDHLDYHKDMENYFKAKSILFQTLNSSSSAIINLDDAYGQRLLGLTKGRSCTYGIKSQADVRAIHIRYSLKGTELDLVFPKGAISIRTGFIGEHNVYNILAAAACAYQEGVALNKIRQGIQGLGCVPGRLEPVNGSQNFFVFIDYAHTPDGLINVLKALRVVSSNKIILVFGCGGDRDKTKRPLMGKAAGELADHSIITSDNPRSEEPAAIIEDIQAGFMKSNYEIIVDRKEAIAHALKLAKPFEIVLIAGKGHEDYQIFKDHRIDFNERQIVLDLLH
ncbi:MAG: UDP-N-acetylmuramoyl-L-alanyl-D-glutamate--2,6-diaminopimelate ligase [Candidatus Omnitrophica bacterium]|nr:UDP-N-acetylmuramoyl-L-alanyl-D-glutamate--2,6-diaminopimelate ligase [Candidatus Omnitrophota bacterium]